MLLIDVMVETQYQCYEKAERKHSIVFVNKQVLSLTDLAGRKLVLNHL